MRTARDRDPKRAANYWSGSVAAREWLNDASNYAMEQVAASDFGYGYLLTELAPLLDSGDLDLAAVPRSTDPDFSWGFFTRVRDRCQNYKRRRLRERQAPHALSDALYAFMEETVTKKHPELLPPAPERCQVCDGPWPCDCIETLEGMHKCGR